MQEIELMEFPLHAPDGSLKGSCGLPVWLFGGEVNQQLLHQVLVAYMAKQRQGNASTRNRARVRGGGRKPWRQKGTGRARAGSVRSPLWRGGGSIFGPRNRNYSIRVTKKMRRIALISAFSIRAGEEGIKVLEVPELERPRTRSVFEMIRNIGIAGTRTLLLTNGKKSNLYLSSKNLPWLTVKPFEQVNCLDVVKARRILIDSEVFKREYETDETDGIS